VVAGDAAGALPWLEEPLRRGVSIRSHAVLVHGSDGVGQFELALALAQAWLCEAEGAATRRPCGACASCRLVGAHSHPDLLVLVPEALREALGWEAAGTDGDEPVEKAGKAKPSRDIKVEAVRQAVAFVQTTAARGRAKAVLLHPAERMNAISANTLLTQAGSLEELIRQGRNEMPPVANGWSDKQVQALFDYLKHGIYKRAASG